MNRMLNYTCPQCNQPFLAKRKNQLYCSYECRVDTNNQLAKERYTTFKEGEPQIQLLQQELEQLKAYVAGLTILLQGVEILSKDTIEYGGRQYHRATKKSQPKNGVHLQKGGAIMLPGNKILFNQGEYSANIWEYSLLE